MKKEVCDENSMPNTESSGFTLVELLITVAVLALILSVAVPNFSSLVSSSNASSAIQRMSSILGYARSESVTRATNVSVCATNNGSTCSGNATDWGLGWLVYTAGTGADLDGDSNADDLLKVESISGLLSSFTLEDDSGNTETFSSICFNNLGEVCSWTDVSVSFKAESNGQESTITLYRTGSIGF